MVVPARMQAVAYSEGDPLRLVELPTPQPGVGEILIKVAAAGVNRPDLLQRDGKYPPPAGAPATLGLEVAGEIVQVGFEAPRWKVGNWVTALVPGGGYAQYAVANASCALPIPKGLSPVQAASLPETIFTVWANVFELGRLQAGELLLVHGGASGIGTTALQMARAAKARIIATVRNDLKAAALRKLGVKDVINVEAQDFSEIVRDLGQADVILDIVGGPYLQKNLDSLAEGGRLVIIGFMVDARAEVNLTRLMLKRLTITGSVLRSRPVEEKARLAAAVEKNVWPWIETGRVKPIVDAVLPLAEAEQAHARMRQGHHVGKIVLVSQ
jgi:NADPH:quinone reductase